MRIFEYDGMSAFSVSSCGGLWNIGLNRAEFFSEVDDFKSFNKTINMLRHTVWVGKEI